MARRYGTLDEVMKKATGMDAQERATWNKELDALMKLRKEAKEGSAERADIENKLKEKIGCRG
jgi:hypothetical protein